jgi:hypothetical protein
VMSLRWCAGHHNLRTLPKKRAHRLPNLSLAQGANGRPAIPPMDWMALKTPRRDPVG